MAISPQDWNTFRDANSSWMSPSQLAQFQQIANDPNASVMDLHTAQEAAGQGPQAKLNAESLDQYNADLAIFKPVGMPQHAPLTQAQFDALKASPGGLPQPGNLQGLEYPGGLAAFREEQRNAYAKMQANKLANLFT